MCASCWYVMALGLYLYACIHRTPSLRPAVQSNVPCELVEHFDPSFPMIVGGVPENETALSFLQVRTEDGGARCAIST